ncbi:MAG: hypothetical protein K8M05_11750 [Deltaproteobacteria bacterium]|nr:hypothetical protein [Kofleriaceae bacterium]
MAERKLHRARADVRPRFRCLVCRRFVLGTEHGTCPQCGWEPPKLAAPGLAPSVTPPRTRWAAVSTVIAVAGLLGLVILLGLLGWIPPGS